MKRIQKITGATSVAVKKKSLSGDRLAHISWMMTDIRQILSGIRCVAATISRLPTSDYALMIQMHHTLVDVRDTITKLRQTADEVNQTITDINQTLAVFHSILYAENRKRSNCHSLN
jgi:hypothetical protein